MMKSFILRGKPVVTIEYPENGRKPLSHCEEARRFGIQIVVKRRRLDGWSRRCPQPARRLAFDVKKIDFDVSFVFAKAAAIICHF